MENSAIKKLSDLIDISDDLIDTFKNSIPGAIPLVKSEILSNKKLYQLIGNNSIKFLEEVLENEIQIVIRSLEFDNFEFLIKNFSKLFSICVNRGFQKEFFKLENFSWSLALSSNMMRYGEEIKMLYSYIYENFERIVTYLDYKKSPYEFDGKDEEFLRNYLTTLLEGNSLEAQILIKNFLLDDERRENLYFQIFYPSLYKIRNLYETGFIDEQEAYMAFSVLNKTLSSIYVEKINKKKSSFYFLYLPVEHIIGKRILNFYTHLEASIFSNLLACKGFETLVSNANQIINENLNFEESFVFLWGISPFNFEDFKKIIEILKAKVSKGKFFIFAEDLENNQRLKNYGIIVNHPKKILEAIENV